MINLTTKLPNQPSALIRLAIQDLNLARKDELNGTVYISMSTWLHFSSDGERRCSMCLAGAVMRYSLNIDDGFLQMVERDPDECTKDELLPGDFNPEIRNKLSALNHFRCGEIENGCFRLGIKSKVADRPLANYKAIGHEVFCRRMLQLADEFAAEGN